MLDQALLSDLELSHISKIGGGSSRQPRGKRRVFRLHQPKDQAKKMILRAGATWLLRRVPTAVVIPVHPEISHQSRSQLPPINWDPTFELVRNSSPENSVSQMLNVCRHPVKMNILIQQAWDGAQEPACLMSSWSLLR